ncbi:AMP-binding protein [Leifsonia sp. fls2-241-R2A-40a]|uniref:AMP-binding protein n=1 Tax=Leifsonia sp. fls2-241-R2A-40a TaxID=3040290 RepID=UPI0025500AC5|nr:AMP-binding protein [Leifsonia sp. fls2-241-R2A-40a]
MSRAVRVIDASQPEDVFAALRESLGGGGDAVVPRSASEMRSAVVPRSASASAPGQRVGGLSWPADDERVAQNVALIIETSGSTGVPKRVALSADALLASAAASAGALGGQGQWLLALPVHYVAGAQVLVRSLAAETEPILYGAGHFDPERFADAAGELSHDLRYTSLVPVQLGRLVEAIEGGSRRVAGALRSFDGILVGGQALNPGLRERAERVGARIVSTYGSSETAGGCVYDGLPIGTTVVREIGGQLEISGPVLAEGYVGDPERSASAFAEHDGVRWYRTGDLGSVDDEGRVSVAGRADNVIISGGEKVLLDAVERVVRELPGLGEAVVVAVPDAEWGQVPVVVSEGSKGTELEAVRRALAERLGRAAAPARIVEVDRMPRLASGKPDRVVISALAAERGA